MDPDDFVNGDILGMPGVPVHFGDSDGDSDTTKHNSDNNNDSGHDYDDMVSLSEHPHHGLLDTGYGVYPDN